MLPRDSQCLGWPLDASLQATMLSLLQPQCRSDLGVAAKGGFLGGDCGADYRWVNRSDCAACRRGPPGGVELSLVGNNGLNAGRHFDIDGVIGIGPKACNDIRARIIDHL